MIGYLIRSGWTVAEAQKEYRKRTPLNSAILVVAMLFALVLAVAMHLTVRGNAKLGGILEDSVKANLLAVCFAASEVVSGHVELFNAINSEEDVDKYRQEFDATIAKLQALRVSVNTNDNLNVKFIYVLKKIGDKYFFIFDTDQEAIDGHDDDDPETVGVVTEYADIARIHLDAFDGKSGAGIMNARDEWGSYNTGAIPLHDPRSGDIIGAIGIDIDDTFIERSKQIASTTATILAVVMLLSMSALLATLILLVRRNASMQADLYRIANRDLITGLPNRHYLFNYLKGKSRLFSADFPPFAVFFVDLDNFKRVNDGAGHDAGDDLLRNIAEFLRISQLGYAPFIQNPDVSSGKVLDAITARIGGDEFLQITPAVADEKDAVAVAKGMLASFQEQNALKPFIEQFEVGLSIGIALFPSMSSDYGELMKLADIAMYHAKYSGKNNFAVYRAEMADHLDGKELSIR